LVATCPLFYTYANPYECPKLSKTLIQNVEDKWYLVESNHLFHATVNKDKAPYTIVIPPQNHRHLTMGHVLNNTLQDVLFDGKDARIRSMLIPEPTCGIATQTPLKISCQEGKHRHDLGREKFIELVWQWRDKYGSTLFGNA